MTVRRSGIRESLSRDEVHLWYVLSDRVTSPKLLSAYHKLMSSDERVQQARFLFERDRHQYLVTRGLVRSLLSKYADVPPEEWRFEKNRYGRPEIEHPMQVPPLRFNLSHTRGMIVCAVAIDREIGVDVEQSAHRSFGLGLARRYFAESEVAHLESLPEGEQRQAFFDFWTLKEAYIKARGRGLSLPLDKFAFHLAGDGPLWIDIDDELQDDPASWQFEQFRPNADHTISLAIRRRDEPDLRINVRRTVPLEE